MYIIACTAAHLATTSEFSLIGFQFGMVLIEIFDLGLHHTMNWGFPSSKLDINPQLEGNKVEGLVHLGSGLEIKLWLQGYH